MRLEKLVNGHCSTFEPSHSCGHIFCEQALGSDEILDYTGVLGIDVNPEIRDNSSEENIFFIYKLLDCYHMAYLMFPA